MDEYDKVVVDVNRGELQSIITKQATQIGMTYEEAVTAAREDTLPDNEVGSDLRLLIGMISTPEVPWWVNGESSERRRAEVAEMHVRRLLRFTETRLREDHDTKAHFKIAGHRGSYDNCDSPWCIESRDVLDEYYGVNGLDEGHLRDVARRETLKRLTQRHSQDTSGSDE